MSKHFTQIADISDGVNAFHVRFTLVVDFDKSSLIESNTCWCKCSTHRSTTNSNENLVNSESFRFGAFFCVFRSVEEINTSVLVFFNAFGEDLGMDCNLLLLDGDFKRTSKFLVENW